MKRCMILAAALCLCLLNVSGCDRSQEQEAPIPQQSAPSQNQPVESVPIETEPPTPVEVIPEEPVQPEEPPYEMASGVWLAETDLGYSNYYYFNAEERSGNYVSLDYGLGMPFSYGGSGDELVFQLEGHEEDVAATVEPADDGEFTLVWEDSLPETLTYVCEGTLEDFHFYSNDELAQLAVAHYTEVNDTTPGSSASMTNEDNTVTVQLYDELGGHNSTAAWYVVDRFTATGTDLTTGEEVDLLAEEEPVAEPPVEEAPAESESAADEAPQEMSEVIDAPVSESEAP